MATGTVIEWAADNKPSHDDIELTLWRYLGGSGEIRWINSVMIVKLPGAPDIVYDDTQQLDEFRFFQVYCDLDGDKPYIEVMTRPISRDDFTYAVARGFAENVARVLGGKIRPT